MDINTVKEPARDISVLDEVDVVVVGGGPAGIGAALASGRTGAKTALIDRFGSLGGQQTNGLNSVFSLVDPEIHNGLIMEIMQRLWDAGAARKTDKMPGAMQRGLIARMGTDKLPKRLVETNYGWWGIGSYFFDIEYYKYMLDAMMREAGVKVYFHAFAAGAIREGNTLKGVIIEAKEGRRAILGKIVIDTTGDGDIAWKSGAPVMDDSIPLGRRAGGHMGTLTCFYVGGVDVKKYLEFRANNMADWGQMYGGHKLVKEAQARGEYIVGDSIILSSMHDVYDSGRVWVMNPMYGPPPGHHLWMAEEQTKFEVNLRRQAFAVTKLLKENVAGFEKCFVEKTANYPVTSMHRLLGEHVVTVAEMREGKSFDDAVAINNQPPDIWEVTGRFGYEILPHDIPYGALISKDVDNLMAAGTAMSCGIFTDGGLRYCTPSICTGQAVGTAAGLSAKQNISPKKIDVKLVQDTLRKNGAKVSVREVSKESLEPYRFIKNLGIINKKSSTVNISEEEIGKY